MKYFLDHPSACRLYAKCPGWQETLAHFFVRNRRASSRQSLAQDALVFSMKEPTPEVRFRQTILANRAANTHRASLPISISQSIDNLEETGSEKDIPKSNSINTSTDNLSNNTETFGEFQSYPIEKNVTPPQSIADSREDLLSLLKRENSHDNLVRIHRSRNSVPATLLRTAINTRTRSTHSANSVDICFLVI